LREELVNPKEVISFLEGGEFKAGLVGGILDYQKEPNSSNRLQFFPTGNRLGLDY